MGDTQESLVNTAIAVDNDKLSQVAVRWAVDNILNPTSRCFLIHVLENQTYDITGVPRGRPTPTSAEIKEMFLPFRGFCARKGINTSEVVLHGFNVANTLIEYINDNVVGNIVVGASNRSPFTRKFKPPDVPTCLNKSAPDFCSVYVIGKGKVLSVRHASRNVGHLKESSATKPFQLEDQRYLGQNRMGSQKPRGSLGSWRSANSDRSSDWISSPMQASPGYNFTIGSRNSSPTTSMNNLDIPHKSVHQDPSSDVTFSGPQSFRSFNTYSDNAEFSFLSNGSGSSASSPHPNGLEAEMLRLKLQLNEKMELYNTVLRESNTSFRRETELHHLMATKAHVSEEARFSGEAALDTVMIDRQKVRAFMEASQRQQRLTETIAGKGIIVEMKAQDAEQEKTRDALAHSGIRYRPYNIEDIKAATNFFSESLKIGEGGYGPVYKAILDHTPVAIKVLRPDAAQGWKQFEQEVEVLSSMRHPHMVLLLGACPEYGCLVYEYMEIGSLEDCLFHKNHAPPLPWQSRFRIALEIAMALLFLHQAKPEPLVHRDLKPANILLDRNYVSKISDVGLARLVPPSMAESVTQYHMTAAAGTFCYIDPEYQQTGMLSVKSDIYSLGVVLLQILTAMPAMGLTHKVESAIEDGTFEEVLDKVVGGWPVEGALSLANLGLKCCELRKKDRPDLGLEILPELHRLRDLGMDNGINY